MGNVYCYIVFVGSIEADDLHATNLNEYHCGNQPRLCACGISVLH